MYACSQACSENLDVYSANMIFFAATGHDRCPMVNSDSNSNYRGEMLYARAPFRIKKNSLKILNYELSDH